MVGSYGPLIDLSGASSHIGDYVQLVVFIHNSAPLQNKLSKGVEVIQVGDETRPFFSVSIWQKEMSSMALQGSIVFLQNVRITKFHEILEARTVQCSSLQCLVLPGQLKALKGVNDIIGACRARLQIQEKLREVIEWVYRAGFSIHNAASHGYQHTINWRVHEEKVSQECFSLLQVLRLADSCKVNFLASIAELFIPLNSRVIKEAEYERMFITRRLFITGDENLANDLICNGCQLCGAALDSHSRSTNAQSTLTLYCQNNSKHLHKISTIYRPFTLYVCDESECIPVLVKNKAAEIMFGNLKAETVHSSYKNRKHRLNLHSNKGKNKPFEDPDFYLIWLVLVKVLVRQGRNSPLRFKVVVNVDKDIESGRFELVSLSMPCFGTGQ